MLARVLEWFGRHHLSTYMILIGLVPIGIIARPGLLSLLQVAFVASWLFAVREIAKVEGRTKPISKTTLVIASVVALGAIGAMMRMNWLVL